MPHLEEKKKGLGKVIKGRRLPSARVVCWLYVGCTWWWRWPLTVGGTSSYSGVKERATLTDKARKRCWFFFSTLASDFLVLNAWNPPLFIGGGRWTFWTVKMTAKRLATLGRWLCCQSAGTNVRSSWWCMFFQIWLRDKH